MRLRELVPADLGPMSEPTDIVTLFESPAFVYLDLFRNRCNWVRSLCLRRDARFYTHQFHHLWSYIRTRQRIFATESHRTVPAELVRFARAYRRKRRNRAPDGPPATAQDPLLHSQEHRD
jgi:hypothetical protein